MRVLRLINDRAIIFPNFILVIRLNMVELEQSEPPSHDHYPFYLKIHLYIDDKPKRTHTFVK